jgi:mTERF domain-containing protein
MEEKLEPTLVWLQERLLLDDAGVTKLVKKHPSFLGLSLENHKESWHGCKRGLHWMTRVLASFCRSCPQVLGYSIDGNLEPTLSWLQERLSLDDKSLSKLVQASPPVLGCSTKENLEPKLAWLKERLDLDDKSLSKLVKTLPSVLGFSIENNLKPTLAWLQERLDLDDKSLRKLVKTKPQVLSFSIEDTLEPKLAWLQERLSLDDKSLCELVKKLPSVLGYSINTNLEPTIKLYEDCVGSKAAIQLIANRPRILSSSLENRLIPRLVVCQEAGIPMDTGTIQRIAGYTELEWSNSMIFQKNKLL